jgi:hypothetical protein
MKAFVFIVIYLVSFVATINCPIEASLQYSFILNLSVFVYLGYNLIIKRIFNPYLIVVFIFFYLFFILAPIIQLFQNNKILLNGMRLDQGIGIYANAIILLFYITIFISFNYFDKLNIKKNELKQKCNLKESIKKKQLYFLVFYSLLATILSLPYLIKGLNNNASLFENVDEKSIQLIFGKFIMMIPFASLLILFGLKDKIKNKSFIISMFILLGCVILLKNPFTEKRNAIGPIYLTILFYFFEKYVSTNFSFFVKVFFAIVILFPLSSILTHTLGSFDERISILVGDSNTLDFGKIIYEHFLDINYDAWNMIIVIISYVHGYGYSYGYFLIGALFFFIPRSIWLNKPLGSGETVVDKFVSNHGSEFANVSCPLPAEGYINFGIIGVVIFSIFLAYYFSKLRVNIKFNIVDKYFSIYFSFYLFFLLRGDLMNGIAYYAGFLIAYLSLKYVLKLR